MSGTKRDASAGLDPEGGGGGDGGGEGRVDSSREGVGRLKLRGGGGRGDSSREGEGRLGMGRDTN